MLGIQCRIGINQLLCCRKIVAHQPVEIRCALRAFLHLIKDPCHDPLKSVELRRNLLSRNLLVLLMDMGNESLPLIQNLLRLRIELSSVFLLCPVLRLQLSIFRQRLSAQLRGIRPVLRRFFSPFSRFFPAALLRPLLFFLAFPVPVRFHGLTVQPVGLAAENQRRLARIHIDRSVQNAFPKNFLQRLPGILFALSKRRCNLLHGDHVPALPDPQDRLGVIDDVQLFH